MLKFENKSNGRYYYIFVDKDMLDDIVLRIVYGGRYINRTRTILCSNRNLIQREIDRLSRKRLKRGYTLVQD